MEVEVGARMGCQEQLEICLGHMVFAEMENLEEKQVWGKRSVEDQEFGFGQVSFELPVKLQMETPRRWLDVRTCCSVLSGLHVVDITLWPSVQVKK